MVREGGGCGRAGRPENPLGRAKKLPKLGPYGHIHHASPSYLDYLPARRLPK